MDELDKLLLDLQGINVPSNEVFENTSPPKPLDIAHDAHITQGGRLPPTRDEAPPSERVSSVSDQPRTGSSWRLPYTMQRLKRSDSQPPTAGANDAQFQPEIVNQNDFQGSTPPNISILQSSKNRTRLYNISNASSFSNMPPTSPISSQLSSPLIGTRSAILISKASSHSLQPSPIAVSASLSGPTDTSTPPQSSPGTLVLNQSAGSTNSSRSDKLCAVCGLAISRGGAGLRGKFYHSEHFVCSEPSCRRNLKGVVCFERDNQLFCEKDYHVRFSPQCGYCKEPIKDNRVIEALGQTFHRAHFFCSHCGKTFGPEDTFQEYEGKAYCEEDFVMLFALKCSACHGSILEESISALGHKWHARCFTCSEPSCNIVLGLDGFYDYGGKPFCEFHYYEKGSNICNVCTKPIIGRCVVALDRKYHPMHFTCGFCQTNLEDQGYKERSGKPYCGNCYIKLFC